jgi:hypothetical protein
MRWLTPSARTKTKVTSRMRYVVLKVRLTRKGSMPKRPRSTISAPRSVGGGGLDKDGEAIVQLYSEERSDQIGVVESPIR